MILTPPNLLKIIENRGARVSIATGDNGAPKLQIRPNGLVSDLADEIRSNARELRVLLESETVHRWQSAAAPDVASSVAPAATAPAIPDDLPMDAKSAASAMPDARAVGVAVAGATVGAFIRPTPELLALWRALSAFVGVPLTSRHIGALARLCDERPTLTNNDLLDLFAAGLMPDEGDGKPVWIEPEQLADETHATATARAHQNEVTP